MPTGTAREKPKLRDGSGEWRDGLMGIRSSASVPMDSDPVCVPYSTLLAVMESPGRKQLVRVPSVHCAVGGEVSRAS